MKKLLLIPLLLLISSTVFAGNVEKGEYVSKRDIEDVQRRLVAWCDSLGEPMHGLNSPSHVVCSILHSNFVAVLTLIPSDGGIRVKWVASEKIEAAVEDAVK